MAIDMPLLKSRECAITSGMQGECTTVSRSFRSWGGKEAVPNRVQPGASDGGTNRRTTREPARADRMVEGHLEGGLAHWN